MKRSATKKLGLVLEESALELVAPPEVYAQQLALGIAHLSKVDRRLKKVIERTRPCELALSEEFDIYEALCRSIIFQQLSGKAAGTIFQRFSVIDSGYAFPRPHFVVDAQDEWLRAPGLSRNKALAVRDLAHHMVSGLIPSARELSAMSEEDIVKRLVAVRGVGVWTVQMLLIFRLGKLDVLPSSDLGVRKGFARVFGLKEIAAPNVIEAHAEKWRPYRSIASWYLWRALELCLPLIFCLALLCSHCASALALDDGDGLLNNSAAGVKATSKLSAVGCVTWWSHDAVGYHPAMVLRLENSSGQNLVGERIRLQGRFTDLRNGYVTVARKEERVTLLKNEQMMVTLRAPSSFELPIDEFAWPSIECKAMARLGDSGDEGTQDLMIAHLESVTMTDDEARAQLARQTDFRKAIKSPSGSSYTSVRKSAEPAEEPPPKPLLATADGLNSQHRSAAGADGGKHLTLPASLPVLGDDFFVFEKVFGIPIQIEAASPSTAKDDGRGLTWASYKSFGPFDHVYVGTKSGSTGDVIIVTVPATAGLPESQLMSAAKALAGKAYGAQLASFTHSVRYLESGRSEMSLASTPSCRVLTYKVAGSDGVTRHVLALSHLPGDLEHTLFAYASQIRMLRGLLGR